MIRGFRIYSRNSWIEFTDLFEEIQRCSIAMQMTTKISLLLLLMMVSLVGVQLSIIAASVRAIPFDAVAATVVIVVVVVAVVVDGAFAVAVPVAVVVVVVSPALFVEL